MHVWKQLTSDPEVLETVKGLRISFDDDPETCSEKEQRIFSKEENQTIDKEIQKLLQTKVIKESYGEKGQVVSPIFVREKKNGSHRMILNLKSLNEKVEYQKFKMETVQTALQLISKGDYFASIDLRDAYYSIPVHKDFQKYLKFYWRETLYVFQSAAMGLAPVPRKFTKLTKPILAYLHDQGHIITSFIDDSLLMGQTKEEIYQCVMDTVRIFDDLGFTIHSEKSQFSPTQEITYLGFVLNSNSMTITLTEERKQKLLHACLGLLNNKKNKIRIVASCIGLIVASFLAVPLGPLYYRSLEKAKVKALVESKGDWEKSMTITTEGEAELRWWTENIHHQTAPMRRENPRITLQTDSSMTGWGALIVESNMETRGFWTKEEKQKHINYLELLAVYLGLKALMNTMAKTHVKVLSDNTTVVSCINKMGSKSSDLNNLTRQIWHWCHDRLIWLSAAHIPGVENEAADKLSRVTHPDMEWKLNSQLLQEALSILDAHPTIDLFATRNNSQFSKFVSFFPDPEAQATDAFSLHWGNLSLYCFPPFSILSRVLRKIKEDQATGIIVAPLWKNQPFWPVLQTMLIARPVRLSAREHLLQHPCDEQQKHPLRKKLTLLVCQVSGLDCKVKDFLRMQPTLSCHHGETPQNRYMMCTSDNGFSMHVKGKLISFHRL